VDEMDNPRPANDYSGFDAISTVKSAHVAGGENDAGIIPKLEPLAIGILVVGNTVPV
jgi:hypothetical protein